MPEKTEPEEKVFNLDNPDQFKKEMTAAGFNDVTITEFTGYWHIENTGDFLDSMIKGSAPIVMLKRKLSPETWQQKYALMLHYLNQEIKDLPQKLGSKAYIAVGVKR